MAILTTGDSHKNLAIMRTCRADPLGETAVARNSFVNVDRLFDTVVECVCKCIQRTTINYFGYTVLHAYSTRANLQMVATTSLITLRV
jgi:hypothetical protein